MDWIKLLKAIGITILIVIQSGIIVFGGIRTFFIAFDDSKNIDNKNINIIDVIGNICTVIFIIEILVGYLWVIYNNIN